MKKNSLMSSIPFPRLIIYIVILSFLPLLFVGYRYTKKNQEWEAVQTQLLAVRRLSETKARKQYLNTLVRSNYSEADQLYIDNHLESLSFLKKEREALQKLLLNPTFTGNEAAEKRYAFLSSEANRFEFNQGSIQTAEGVQESNLMLAHPVEIDTQDLKEILTRIEGTRKGKPQLIITDLKLHKKAHRTGNEVFELNMKLLKREFS